MKNKILVASYFLSHSAVNKLFFTSDEQCFFQDQDAINHANDIRVGLKDKTVYPFERADVVDEIAAQSAKGGAEGDVVKPYNKMTKAELVAELTKRELDHDATAKNADLIALLEADDQAKAAKKDGE